ncbi:MAG TPA: hypothetical protein VIQ22_08410 [Gammaproteobacteria bacterium]
MSRFATTLLFIAFAGYFSLASAQEITREQIKGLDEQVQDIKKDVLAISTELNLLEEKLLYPSNTQVSLFISLKGDEDFRLDSVEIEMDGKAVAHHIYSFKELEALHAGGMQRIYTGNIRSGTHEIKVGYAGKTSTGNDYSKVESYQFDKGVGPGLVEISLAGPGSGSKSIEFKDW